MYHKTNRETMVEIKESVRGKDVYIIQTGSKCVNDSLMELLIMCYACKTSSCNNVIGVVPYIPYSMQTKMKRRGNISLKLIAQMMSKAGFDHIITLDLHSKESIGFFDCAIDNLRASPFLIQYIQGKKPYLSQNSLPNHVGVKFESLYRAQVFIVRYAFQSVFQITEIQLSLQRIRWQLEERHPMQNDCVWESL